MRTYGTGLEVAWSIVSAKKISESVFIIFKIVFWIQPAKVAKQYQSPGNSEYSNTGNTCPRMIEILVIRKIIFIVAILHIYLQEQTPKLQKRSSLILRQ